MVAYYTASGSVPAQFAFSGMDTVTLPHTTGVRYIPGAETIGLSGSTRDPGEYAIVQVTARRDAVAITASGSTGTTTKEYDYSILRIAEQPSMWTPAKTADGRVLNDAYLVSAGSAFNQAGQPQIELLFNDEGKSIFAEITKRLLGKQLAIYV
jgi:hypothetical protein